MDMGYDPDWGLDSESRNHFIFRVYTILFIQLFFTVGVVLCVLLIDGADEFFYDRPYIIYIAMIIGLATYIALACCTPVRRSYPVNIILLSIMTLCFAIMAAIIASAYEVVIVMYALMMTAGIVFLISLVAKCGTFDFTSCAFYLMIFGLLFIVFAIVTTFVMIFAPIPILHLIYSCLAVLLFSMYLLFDTQQIIGGGRIEMSKDEYIYGAIQLYIDIFQIFINLLTIISALFGDSD